MNRLTLGGRAFVPVGESTVEHDYHFMGLLRRAGLEDPSMREGETAETFARRLVMELAGSGVVLEALGCLLVPVPPAGFEDREPGETWTPDMAKETAAFLGGLTNPEDKAAIRSLILTVLISFFESGSLSSGTSATSSRSERPQVDLAGQGATAPGAA